MTVKELIKELEKQDPNATVMVEDATTPPIRRVFATRRQCASAPALTVPVLACGDGLKEETTMTETTDDRLGAFANEELQAYAKTLRDNGWRCDPPGSQQSAEEAIRENLLVSRVIRALTKTLRSLLLDIEPGTILELLTRDTRPALELEKLGLITITEHTPPVVKTREARLTELGEKVRRVL